MSDDATTARAQRRQAAAAGDAPDAVDRRSRRTNPRGSAAETTSRARQLATQRETAAELDIDPSGVGAIDRIGRGPETRLRSAGVSQWDRQLREQFAGEADFVTSDDVATEIDPRRITAEPQVARDRRSDVADRARRETAADMEFVQRGDLDADVTARGVTGIAVAEERRDAVADRTARGLASDDEFAEPDDFGVDVTASGIEQAALTDAGARRRAGRQFESETALDTVDPTRDVTATDDGFALAEPGQRRIAATEFEADTPLGSVDPQEDVVADGDGFGLAEPRQREVAARGFEDELEQFGAGELDPTTDVRETDDGFGLAEGPARDVAAAELDRQVDEVDVSPGDIELEETDDGQFEAVFEREVER